MKLRQPEFDILKGLAIFLVVMGHVITFCIRDIDRALLFKMIGAVHMPLFFFISGWFTYKPGFKRPDLVARFNQLIVPMVVMSVLFTLYFPHSGLQSPLAPTLGGMIFESGKNGYWFPLALMWIMLVYAAIAPLLRLTRRWWQTVAVMAAAAVGAELVYKFSTPRIDGLLTLSQTARYLVPFLAGVLARIYRDRFDRAVADSRVFTVNLLLLVPTMYCSMYYWEVELMSHTWFNITVTAMQHICTALFAFALVRPWSARVNSPEGSATGRFMSGLWVKLGRDSLAIYLIHYFFLFPLTPLQDVLRGMGLGMVPCLAVSITVAAAVVAASECVIFILNHSPLLSRLLTGRLKSV